MDHTDDRTAKTWIQRLQTGHARYSRPATSIQLSWAPAWVCWSLPLLL